MPGISLGIGGSKSGLSPAIRANSPSLDLDFLKGVYQMSLISKAFADIFTFSRASTGTRINASGVMETVAANQPRFDYDLSAAIYNLLTYSQDFSNSAWAKSNASITTGHADPWGGTSANKLVGNAVNTNHYLSYVGSVPAANNTCTYAVIAKAGEESILGFGVAGGTAFNCNFNLSAGTFVANGVTAEMLSLGGGWYLCCLVATPTAYGNVPYLTLRGTQVSFAGDASSGLYLARCGLSQGALTAAQIQAAGGIPLTTAAPAWGGVKPAGLLIEEQRTNKSTNANFNPVSTSGLTKFGDAASVLSLVSDTSALLSAGLSGVCSNGNVFKLDNSAGVADAYVVFSGAMGSTNSHVTSAYVRGSGTVKLGGYYQDASLGSFALSSGYVKRAKVFTSAASADQSRIQVTAGSVVYFILNQVEEGSFETSIIPNSGGSQVTRAADVCSINTLSPWYKSSEGSVFVEASVPVAVPSNKYPQLVQFLGSAGNLISVGFLTATVAGLEVTIGGVSQVNKYPATGDLLRKIAAGFRENDFAVVVNGSAVEIDSSCLMPAVTSMSIGAGTVLNGYIRKIRYFPKRLTNAQLQSLTA